MCGKELGAIEDDAYQENPRMWGADDRVWFACPDHGRGYVDRNTLREASHKKSGSGVETVIAQR